MILKLNFVFLTVIFIIVRANEDFNKTVIATAEENENKTYTNGSQSVKKSDSFIKTLSYYKTPNNQVISNTFVQNPFTIPLRAPQCPKANEIDCSQWLYYRTTDGTCNNLKYKWFGSEGTPFQRLLAPAYTDGVDAPRVVDAVKSFKPLPNPYEAAFSFNSLFTNEDEYSRTFRTNGVFIFLADFIAHDMTKTVGPDASECSCDQTNTEKCFNIGINSQLVTYLKSSINYYGSSDTTSYFWVNLFVNGKCRPFARSTDIYNTDFPCRFKTREQFSKVTHWIDASQVYGSNDFESNNARYHASGLLKFDYLTQSDDREKVKVLPILNEAQCEKERATGCYYSPDGRTEEYSMRICMHTFVMREHNRIAKILLKKNPHWLDEKVYQEARRLVIAIIQKFTYADFLPVLLGPELMSRFKLNVLKAGYLKGYNELIYANVYNEFSTAAFRLHNYLSPYQSGASRFLCSTKNVSMEEYYFGAVHGYKVQNDQCRGIFITESLRKPFYIANPINYQYNNDYPEEGFRASLPAINVQRGRDHGIAGYGQYRSLARGFVDNLDELYDISDEIKSKLKYLYGDTSSIDLWVGMAAENLVLGSKVGITQGFIIAKQFHDTKYGDRFYFENGHDEKTRFTEGQLHEIRKYALSKFLCNSIDIEQVPLNPFELVRSDGLSCKPNEKQQRVKGRNTVLVSCSDIADIDFDFWNEESYESY